MIGIDIAKVTRFSLEEKFLKKIAFDDEIDYIFSVKNERVQRQRVASLWAVKEAVMKALGLGKDSGVAFKDIRLLHYKSGKPMVELFGKAKQEFDISFYGKTIDVSISHEDDVATAIAIIL